MTNGVMTKKKVDGKFVEDESRLRQLLAADQQEITYLRSQWLKANMVAERLDDDRFAPQPTCIAKHVLGLQDEE